MKKNNLDITISSSIILVTLALVLFGLSESGFVVDTLNSSFKESVFFLLNDYLDFILIFYVFICLQIAGYVELKYKKDYLLISMICILFTPFSIFFIIKDKKK
tara:strand:- start:513 stop:821 length:309 start_codon:yes stop_codon:yes gene_type:complete